MANCANIKSFTYDACQGNIGGVKRVWIANYVDSPVVVSESGDTEGVITGFTTGVTTGGTFYEFKFRKNTASMTSTINVSDNGSSYVSTELNMVFSRMDADKRAAMMSLLLSESMIVVEDCNSVLWFLGETNPVSVSQGDGQTGTAKSDNNAYSITLLDDNTELPRQFSVSNFSDYIYVPNA